MVTALSEKTPETPPGDDEHLLTLQEVADHFRMSTRQIQRLTRRDHDPLPVIRFKDTRMVRFRRAEVDAWVDRTRESIDFNDLID